MPDLLILVGDKGIISKCGPSCYNASFSECACICRGINHGVGYKQGLSNIHDDTFLLDKRFKDLKLSIYLTHSRPVPHQITIFI